MLSLVFHWLLSAVSITAISKLLPGVHVKSFGTSLIVAAVYGILHVLLFKILAFIFFVPRFLTFRLFDLVINAFLLYLTDELLENFEIDSLGTTLLAAVALTILNSVWDWLLF